MILKVSRLGNPVLRMKAQPVEPGKIVTPRFQEFLRDLFETMQEYDGVGIAAPQVHFSVQAAVIQLESNARYPKAPKIRRTVLINPQVRPVGKATEEDWEGCLSVDGFRGLVPRWREVEVKAYNERGELVRFRAKGFFARVVQHEWDHLQGKVFLDRMKDLKSLTHLKEYARYWAENG